MEKRYEPNIEEITVREDGREMLFEGRKVACVFHNDKKVCFYTTRWGVLLLQLNNYTTSWGWVWSDEPEEYMPESMIADGYNIISCEEALATV